MATLKDVKDEIAALKQTVTDEAAEVAAKIQALKDQIAQGSAATPEDMDGVLDALKGVQNAVAGIVTPDAQPNSGGGPGEEQPTP